ncbi:MAG: hypothetical protein QG568_278 [Patescibacteria group bacterium]|nr:hypothetical protein [Patescibacteria group bacterium]
MNLKKYLTKQNILSILVPVVLFASVPVVLAWKTPQVAPPGGNIDAPINVGIDYQIKRGKLGFFGPDAALRVSKGADYVPTGDSNNKLASLLIGVNGNVGADKYCDEWGNDCIDLSNLANGNNTNINNTNINTNNVNTCVQRTKSTPFVIQAGNDASQTKTIDLPAGTWNIVGVGSLTSYGNSVGEPRASVVVSKDGSFTVGQRTLLRFTGEFSGHYRDVLWVKNGIGFSGTRSGIYKWTIPSTVNTFTLDKPEKMRISVSQGQLFGMFTFDGPESFVCSTEADRILVI